MTSWNGKIDNENGEYTISFTTGNYEYYKIVEKACQRVIDKKDKAVLKERAAQAKTMGYVG